MKLTCITSDGKVSQVTVTPKQKNMNTDIDHRDFEVERIEFETCVMCNVDTNVPKSMHIDFRNNYVEGAGQLCFNCYTKTLNYIKE